jgi:threonine aldolase
LVVIENTHNRAGGRIFPQADVLKIVNEAHARGLSAHLDGARIWNASVALGVTPAELAAPFETASVCFSKGLGAPVGSAFVGSREHVKAAHRFRKMLGGGMRQSGVLAAAALHALEHHVQRLAEDHAAARAFADVLRGAPGVEAPSAVDTNIVQFAVTRVAAGELMRRAAARGVLLNATSPRTLRAVTHLDISAAEVVRAAQILAELA